MATIGLYGLHPHEILTDAADKLSWTVRLVRINENLAPLSHLASLGCLIRIRTTLIRRLIDDLY